MATSEAVRSSRHGPATPAGADHGGSRSPRAGLALIGGLAGIVGLVVMGAGASASGAFTALVGFDDGGALARIGLPVARVVVDVAAALTIGLLLLAGTMIPERTRTTRRETACRLATVTAAVWTLGGVALLLLTVSNVSGIHVTDPGFGAQVADVVWSFDFFRVLLISALFALAVTVGAAVVRTTVAITWMAVLALVGVVVLALIGHAAGAAAHDTAVNSLAVHLAGALTWMGGLGALVILRPILGDALPVTARRFSVLAGWAYGAVAISGVLNGWLRLGSLSGLATTYGLLLVGKLVLLAALGAAGWRMRSALLDRLDADPASGKAFAGLATVEVGLLAAAVGLGIAMSRSAPPVPQKSSADIVTALTGYPDPGGPPTALDWFTMVRVDWLWLTVVCLAVGLYAAAVIRLRRRGDAWPPHRTILWVVGWAFFLWTTNGAPGIYGRLTFSAHMLMHMMLTMGVPVFLALGAPLTLASRALPARRDKTLGPREILLQTAHSRWLTFWANPIVAGINFVGSLYVFYFSHLFDLALRTHTGHVVMVVHFMLAGYIFTWALVGVDPGPRRWAPSLRLVLLFATMSFHAFFGIAIISARELLAGDFFTTLALPWVGDLLADQEKGGGITWGVGEFPMLALALIVAFVWMRADEHEAKRKDRQADRDDGAELAAYNASLAARGEMIRRAEADELRHAAAVQEALLHPRQHRPRPGPGGAGPGERPGAQG